MMRLKWMTLVCFGLLLITGCSTTRQGSSLHRFEYAELHMGTVFRIVLYAPDKMKGDAAAVAAFQRVGKLDDVMSDYDPKSELMQLCGKPAGVPVKVSQELFDILRESQRVAKESDGVFDVTVGPYVRLWRVARKKKVLPSQTELAEAAKAVGYRKLVMDEREGTVTLTVPNMRLDLGGIAKGYAADQALGVMRRMGISRAMVAASGDIAVGDAPPGHAGWAIGIASIDPKDESLQKTVLLKNAGISTSGDMEQGIEIDGVRYSHVVNPATGLGLTERIQATVIGPNAMTTDGLDNTVCAMGVQRGLALIDSLPRTAALVVTKDEGGKHVFTSRRFKQLHFQN
ncbi:MAG: FAD:protein transferase [Pedosphaera sp.]|nr:FAD:protein transferase [Pedosphaera sp.]